MVQISYSPEVKASRLTNSLISISSLLFVLTLSCVTAAPSIDVNPRMTPKLIFWFKDDGNHRQEYFSHANINCDPLPAQVSKGWDRLTVMLERGQGDTNEVTIPSDERCAVLYHHGNCVDPVMTLDFSTPQSSLPRGIKSYRYCHGPCSLCLTPTTTPTPTTSSDYDAENK